MPFTFSQRSGHPVWAVDSGPVRVRFVGRGPGASPEEVLGRLSTARLPLARLRQVHGDRVVQTASGGCSTGDALVTARSDLVLAVVSADCVPIVLAGSTHVAAVHAGWRGVVAGVIPRAVAALGEDPTTLSAWIGPAIGVCCYEVGPDVAARLATAGGPDVVSESAGGRPHADLPAAAARQLRVAHVLRVQSVAQCTACDSERLCSYRRDGPHSGRNVTLVWRAS